MDNLESQNEEILALRSIYGDENCFRIDGINPACGQYAANVRLSEPLDVILNHNVSESKVENNLINEEKFQVQYLPPIKLCFELPPSYPSDTCPAFFISCNWLSLEQLSNLCRCLEFLWTEGNGEVVLFNWINFLEEEVLDTLNIKSCLDITELSKFNLKKYSVEMITSDTTSLSLVDKTKAEHENDCYSVSFKSGDDYEQCSNVNRKVRSILNVRPTVSGGSGSVDCRAVVDLPDGKLLKTILKDYDDFRKQEVFEKSWHTCNICFMEKQGIEFVTFKMCHHFFCKECLKSYFEIQIKDGNVHSLNCPEDKCTFTADGFLVKQIVNAELFQKYDDLLLSRTLESMPDVAYCPRKVCQCALFIDVTDRMGTCPACKFVFCPYCKMAYHGIAPCNFKSEEKQKICEDYLAGDSAKKTDLEKRYGKRALKSLVENNLSEKWIYSNSKNCPNCGASIEKTEGCNKMTCFRCGIFFCWLCMRKLMSSNPYFHFNDRNSECFDKLFPEEYVDNEFDFLPGEFLNLI